MTPHRRDLVSLFFGLVFALCGLAFLNRSEDWDVFDSGGLLAFGLIAVGALGVVLVLTGTRHGRSHAEPDAFAPNGATTEPTAADFAAAAEPSNDLPTDDTDLDLPGFDDPYGPDDQLDPS